ncbi:hypothetical protein TNCV_4018491 [Trichonephila clavipes]|nr:hypothetical protein TNCV_4018491 [Trichonephila clavipes]
MKLFKRSVSPKSAVVEAGDNAPFSAKFSNGFSFDPSLGSSDGGVVARIPSCYIRSVGGVKLLMVSKVAGAITESCNI